MASPNVLDPSSVLHTLQQCIPNSLQSGYDALAAASHAVMLSVGFRFAGLGDDARQEGDGTKKQLPNEWNEHSPHFYAFRYSHPQSSLTFVLKSLRLGDRWIVHGLGIGDDKTATLDIVCKDYTSDSFFPYQVDSDKPLVHGFISTDRFNDFIVLFKINIIQRLIPGLTKPGYTESDNGSTNTDSRNSNRSQPRQPLSSETNPPPRPAFYDPPFSPDDPSSERVNPLNVGQSDLEPAGGRLRMPGVGSGMFVGPDHPIFGRSTQGHDDDSSHIFGGPQPLPRGAVPPGARFDPIGPFGARPGRGGIRPRGSGRFSGEPDNDELPPPGYNDMFM
ncbi:PI31 proteasome regulator N-terminal-domain-containing protein [Radiomyces spectabilis]|uniref:PI31 proteasome regulator N-terminal-domain-containing protein n=1 Tax=Radiomyces spectabilis TaxID=64574 RepID=UPI002220D002|nr:PI31 proteasome regulator N-terminal-domain-containing protein [Radiomyces spectabilis]KAI8371588.1 PI31 proteasome regulator N-terminal-domain-containing protein [Radiomyces spectabilis]